MVGSRDRRSINLVQFIPKFLKNKLFSSSKTLTIFNQVVAITPQYADLVERALLQNRSTSIQVQRSALLRYEGHGFESH